MRSPARRIQPSANKESASKNDAQASGKQDEPRRSRRRLGRRRVDRLREGCVSVEARTRRRAHVEKRVVRSLRAETAQRVEHHPRVGITARLLLRERDVDDVSQLG